MTKSEVMEQMKSFFPYMSGKFADESYAVMTEDSFLKTSPYMTWIMREFGISGWEKKFDCDDFALLWKMLTSLRHAKAQGGTSEGVACGIVWYVKDGGQTSHAVNIVKTERGWQMFEPQTEEFITLSKTERESVWLVLF